MALVLGGMISAFGMFNALVMSYCRLPLAMAQNKMLPSAFARLHSKTGAPWVAIVACAIGWALCVGMGFERLITLDVLLAGASVLLEFAALVALRVREPELDRPFRVPGGMAGAALIGILPMLLLGFAVVHSADEQVWGINGLVFGSLIIFAGFRMWRLQDSRSPAQPVPQGVAAD